MLRWERTSDAKGGFLQLEIRRKNSVTYSTVVSRESVRKFLTIAALNDLEVLAANVKNAFLTAPCR